MIKTNALPQRGLKKFWASNSGGVLIYLAFGLPMLLGVMALSIDLGRAFILNTELKDFSDAAALAGAAELDGRDGARVAAESAARTGLQGTLVNIQAFATDGDGAGIVVDDVVFLKNLPADGTDFVVADTATTDAEARFVFVSVVNRDVRSGLSRALGAIPDFDTGAKSIAGFTAVNCRIPAMFMCNPLEDPTMPLDGPDGSPVAGCPQGGATGYPRTGANLNEACLRGRQMLSKQGGGAGSYVPGNFGLLDCPTGAQGTNCVAPFIASAEPGFCVTNRANLRTGGAVGPVRTAINTRFDMYENPFFGGAGVKSNPLYRPGLNVVKGHRATDVCKTPKYTNGNPPPTQSEVMGYPRDLCFREDNCTGSGKRWGNWGWQDHTNPGLDDDEGEQYLNTNHPSITTPITPGATLGPETTVPWNEPMTRYELYRYEIAAAAIPNNVPSLGTGAENAAMLDPAVQASNPQCYTGSTLSDPSMDIDADDSNNDDAAFIDRRILTLAVVNCVAEGPLNGNEGNVPVIGYIDLFLTEPAVGDGSDKANIYSEVVRVVENGESGLRDIVQLYR